MKPSVSVVIVTYNSATVIRGCLDSLRGLVSERPVEVVVVDNVSSDDTREIVRTEYPEVNLIEATENLGYARANNLGAGMAGGEFLVLLNPDTVMAPDAVSLLADALSRDTWLWVAGPKILDPQGNVGHSYGDLPDLWWALAFIGPGRRLGWRSSRVVVRVDDGDAESDVGFVTGASMATTRVAWERLAGLDSAFFLYFEDADYCARVWRAGGRVGVVPAAHVVHLEGASFSGEDAARNLRFLQGLVLYLAKNVSPVAAQLFRISVLAEYWLYVLASYMPGRRFDGVRRNRETHRSSIRVLGQRGLARGAARSL